MVQLVDRNKFSQKEGSKFMSKTTVLTKFPKKITFKNGLHVKVAFSVLPSNLTQEFHLSERTSNADLA